MRKYVVLFLVLIGFVQIPYSFACSGESDKKKDDRTVKAYRDDRVFPDKQCFEFEFPSSLGDLSPAVEVFADDFHFYLGGGRKISDKENRHSVYMCLSKKILKDVTIDVTYGSIPKPDGKVSFCMDLIRIQNLPELLAQSDKEAAEKK